jgi:hypothetical protein
VSVLEFLLYFFESLSMHIIFRECLFRLCFLIIIIISNMKNFKNYNMFVQINRKIYELKEFKDKTYFYLFINYDAIYQLSSFFNPLVSLDEFFISQLKFLISTNNFLVLIYLFFLFWIKIKAKVEIFPF